MNNKIYLSHSRVGIWIAIKNENITEKFNVLLPDYICESVPNYLLNKKINIIFYKIDKTLNIDWNDLDNKLNDQSKFLIIVNYFGFPMSLNKSIEYAKKNKLILIEDSTHCHGGKFENIKLGNFGDYGITSPRKHIPIKYGGIIYSKKHISINGNYYYISTNYDKLNYYLSKNFLKKKLFLKNIIKKKSKHIFDTFEDIVKFSYLDKFSIKIIENTNWNNIKKEKAENFEFWRHFCKKNNLHSIINERVDDLNPWAFPVLMESQNDVVKWINWGIKNKVILYSWPTISSSVSHNSDAKEMSKKLLCFSTYCKL